MNRSTTTLAWFWIVCVTAVWATSSKTGRLGEEQLSTRQVVFFSFFYDLKIIHLSSSYINYRLFNREEHILCIYEEYQLILLPHWRWIYLWRPPKYSDRLISSAPFLQGQPSSINQGKPEAVPKVLDLFDLYEL